MSSQSLRATAGSSSRSSDAVRAADMADGGAATGGGAALALAAPATRIPVHNET